VHAPELYESIMSFDIDGDDPEFAFARRLARGNGWTLVARVQLAVVVEDGSYQMGRDS